jgi:hypothetical protein
MLTRSSELELHRRCLFVKSFLTTDIFKFYRYVRSTVLPEGYLQGEA